MRIDITQDLDRFTAAAGSWLAEAPVGNNVLLSTIAAQRCGHLKGSAPAWYAWAQDRGEVLGALRWPPPLPATLTDMPAAVAAALAAALADQRAGLPGVNGPSAAVAAFAARWERLTGRRARPYRELLVSRLREVRLELWPQGAMRAAVPDEAPVLSGWIAAVLGQAGVPAPEETARQQIDEQLADGRLYVWETGGEPAAVTGHAAPVAGVALVHGGFTSPVHRESWYGTAVVAAVSARLRDLGHECVSITDQANPHAHATLRAIGYEPAGTLSDVRFAA